MKMAKECRDVLHCCAAANAATVTNFAHVATVAASTAATVTNFANVATVAATTAVVVIKQTIGFV